jgi:CheY-like chemotaxis protein
VNKTPCKVLVVDDERANADSTVRLLRAWAHEAEVAYSAEDAISKAIAFDPDVVLIDIGMPVMNGFDLVKELRQYCPGAKFVALTGYPPEEIVRRADDAGFARILTKPAFDLEQAVGTECAAAPIERELSGPKALVCVERPSEHIDEEPTSTNASSQ